MDRRRARLGYWSGIVAIALMAAFGIVLVLLHIMVAQNGKVPYYLSHFRLTPFSELWIAGLILFAAGAFALSLALHAAMPGGAWAGVTLASVWVVGPLALIVAIFPAAAPGAVTTWEGRVHEIAAIAMFVALGIAMVSLFPALRWGWPGLAWASLFIGVAFFALTPWMIMGFIAGTPDVAISERIVVALHGAWLLTMGLWSRAETAPFVLASARRTRQAQPTQ